MSLFMLFQGVCHQILPPQLDMFPTIRISAAAEFESLLAENRWICGRLSSEHCSVCCTPCKRHGRIYWRLGCLWNSKNEINFKLHTCHSSIFFENTWINEGLTCANVCKKCNKQTKTSTTVVAVGFLIDLERLHCRCFSKVDNNRGVLAVSNDDGLYLRLLCHR